MKVVFSIFVVTISILSYVQAQDLEKLPTVKTFWTVPSNQNKYDIHLTPAETGLKGALRWVGPRCVVEQEVEFRNDSEGFVGEVASMKAIAETDSTFCNRKMVVIFPKKKSFLGGFKGSIFIEGGKGSGLQDSTYFFHY